MLLRRSLAISGISGPAEGALTARFEAARAELEIQESFSAEALAEAEMRARNPDLPQRECLDLEFVTLDPPDSTDLDQAFFIQRRAEGLRLYYAIADVPAFVPVTGALAEATLLRGQTLYAPDKRVPLHPEVISEHAASLLPGQIRPAYVWEFDLDAAGNPDRTDLYRAMIRSRERLNYQDAESLAVSGASTLAAQQCALLREFGIERIALERARGGASLPIPDQEVNFDGSAYHLTFRPGLESEDWNAQLSLLTGITAGTYMLDAGIGLLRTMPRPEAKALGRFRRQARALGIHWPRRMAFTQFLRSLDRFEPNHLALIHASGFLFRGAGYTVLGGEPPELTRHAAIASTYAHVTAPLRRLVDRFGLVIAHAVAQGQEPPAELVAQLDELPSIMKSTDQVARKLERKCVNLAEAAVLEHRIGDEFHGICLDDDGDESTIQIDQPAVIAQCRPAMTPGDEVLLTLSHVDLDAGVVEFSARSLGAPVSEDDATEDDEFSGEDSSPE